MEHLIKWDEHGGGRKTAHYGNFMFEVREYKTYTVYFIHNDDECILNTKDKFEFLRAIFGRPGFKLVPNDIVHLITGM